jgi:hypothetical protein
MASWLKIVGTQTGKFILGLTGATLKNNSGTGVQVRNNADSAYADIEAKNHILQNNTTAYSVTLTTSDTQSASYTLTLPENDGSSGQVLQTDGSGVLTWASAASTDMDWKVDSTSIAFGSGSTVSMFTLPANAVINTVSIIVDTAFDGTPSVSVGVSGGSASKYAGSGDSLLTVADRYDIPNQSAAVGTTEALQASYSAGGATTGSGRILVTYAVPA